MILEVISCKKFLRKEVQRIKGSNSTKRIHMNLNGIISFDNNNKTYTFNFIISLSLSIKIKFSIFFSFRFLYGALFVALVKTSHSQGGYKKRDLLKKGIQKSFTYLSVYDKLASNPFL